MKRLYADFLTGLIPVRVIKGSATFDEFFRRWYVDVIVTREGGGYPWGGCADVQYRKGEELRVNAQAIVESAGRGKIRTVWRDEWLPVKDN